MFWGCCGVVEHVIIFMFVLVFARFACMGGGWGDCGHVLGFYCALSLCLDCGCEFQSQMAGVIDPCSPMMMGVLLARKVCREYVAHPPFCCEQVLGCGCA
ncbi:hypothetical protein CFELI_01680 [Corynebacterium felinum]|nr:hypothetical protein CFELI_01680 [Corynebacterium felinum]